MEGAQGAQAPVAIAPQTKPETPANARTNPSYLNIHKGRVYAPPGEGAWGNRARGFPHIIQGRTRARRTASAPTESATAHPPKPWGAREFLSRDQWRPRKPTTHGTRGSGARQGQGRGDGARASPQRQARAEACAQGNRGHERGARQIQHGKPWGALLCALVGGSLKGGLWGPFKSGRGAQCPTDAYWTRPNLYYVIPISFRLFPGGRAK